MTATVWNVIVVTVLLIVIIPVIVIVLVPVLLIVIILVVNLCINKQVGDTSNSSLSTDRKETGCILDSIARNEMKNRITNNRYSKLYLYLHLYLYLYLY